MTAQQDLTISLTLWQVYYSNQERIEARFQAWLDYAYVTNTAVPNVVCMSHLAATRANRQLLEFYLGATGDDVLPELPSDISAVEPDPSVVAPKFVAVERGAQATAPAWLKDSKPLPPLR